MNPRAAFSNFRAAFSNFVKKHIVDNMPPHLDDEANYGHDIDKIARCSGQHPKYIIWRLKTYSAFNKFSKADLSSTHALTEAYLKREGISGTSIQQFDSYQTTPTALKRFPTHE